VLHCCSSVDCGGGGAAGRETVHQADAEEVCVHQINIWVVFVSYFAQVDHRVLYAMVNG